MHETIFQPHSFTILRHTTMRGCASLRIMHGSLQWDPLWLHAYMRVSRQGSEGLKTGFGFFDSAII